MPDLDGTGMGKGPPEKDGRTAYQDATPQSGKSTGQGDSGSGPSNETGRTTPVHGSK